MAQSRRYGRAINRQQLVGPDDIFAAQGMIPTRDFVDQNGDLTPASFRFLHSVYLAIARIEERMAAAGIPRADV